MLFFFFLLGCPLGACPVASTPAALLAAAVVGGVMVMTALSGTVDGTVVLVAALLGGMEPVAADWVIMASEENCASEENWKDCG